MKSKKHTFAKRCHLVIQMLLIMISIVSNLYGQKISVDPKPQPTEAAENSLVERGENSIEPQKNTGFIGKWTALIKDWMERHTELAIIFGAIIFIGTWFKERIRRLIVTQLFPLFTRLITWVFIRLGAYNTLLNRYRQTLQTKLKEVGLTQQFLGEAVDLDKNYIPLQLSKEEYKNPETTGSDESERGSYVRPGLEEPKMERIEVLAALADEANYGNRIAIIGDPGSGKTTLLQHLAYQYTKGKGKTLIPVLITLTAYVQHKSLNIRAYLETIFEENGFPKARDFIERQLKKGNLIILFDGFDEVEIGKREELLRQIDGFSGNHAYLQNKFIVTSRPIGEAVFNNFRHLEVMPLTAEHRTAFLESKTDESPGADFNLKRCADLSKSIEEHDRIRKLAENPLLLTFLYHVYKYNLELPRRRVELYRLSVNLMLDWDMETNRPTHIKVKDRDAKKEVLKKVAYFYHTSNRRELPEEILFAQLKTFLPDSLREKFTPKEFIQEIENSSGILRHRTAETFQFIHLTFQEYLTAEYINDNRDVELPKLLTNLHNPWWREVTLLLASSMGNGTPLVERILDYGLQVADESERFSCLFIAFNCLFEAEIHVEVRDKVLDAFVKLPYNQVLDVIQEIVGPFEVGNEELETLFVNILNSPHDSVQAWGLSFLNSYPEIAETSKRLPKRIKEVSSQALRKLPDELQTHLLGALSLERITDAIWNTLVKDQEITAFDYLQRLYTQCMQNELPVETHQKLLLAQSDQLLRLLIGGLSLQSTPTDSDRKSRDEESAQQGTQLQVDVPFFTPDGKNLPSSPDFTKDFAKIWQDAVPQFINVLRPLILTLSPALDLNWRTAHELDKARAQDWALDADLIRIRDNGLAGTRSWPWARTLARALNKARELTRDETLGRDLIQDTDRVRDLALDRIRSRTFSGEELSRTLPRARSLVMDHKLLPIWNLIQNLTSNPNLDLNLNLDLAQDLDVVLDLIQVLDRARALSLDRKVIELLLLAQELILAWALIHAREIIRNGSKSMGFVQSFLETVASKDHDNPWYIFMISQQINAAVFARPDDEPFFVLQQQWEQRSDNPDIALYQSTFFINFATLLHTFGIKHDGTFFDEVFEKSIHPQAPFVLRVSYLLYRIITNQATETEQQEFWKSLQTSASPIEREWFELSGLSLLQKATDTQ